MSDANYPRLPKLVSIKLRVSTLNVLIKASNLYIYSWILKDTLNKKKYHRQIKASLSTKSPLSHSTGPMVIHLG